MGLIYWVFLIFLVFIGIAIAMDKLRDMLGYNDDSD